ncbi:hypothetical protein SPSIL_006550 [Sporomusa silvacetica DSM 10669]|uniref:SLH domain-containing protein n=1 Tax=Sporomusa silvacetica DSM 10669 TaxID=1123289 RepID=A0ABZ3IGM2_9FIRM|nr:S-layer homology domain-containing protein [Sporomusa silvacetica]OZC17019.1 hypothetical protein SPSIL_33840 [Sporomusa silvacetica DSM 10669]
MRKSVALLAALTFVSASWLSAGAAENHFGDVPANHWAYNAINKLAKDGVIDLYGEGALRGERTLTRYEMAQIVARSIWNSNKASSVEDKGLIDQLKTEFADELDNLGVSVSKTGNATRVDKEDKKEKLQIDGHYMFRYEYVKNPRPISDGYAPNYGAGTAAGKVTERNHLWLDLTNEFDGDTYFAASLVAESMSGTSAANSLDVYQAFMSKKIGNNAELAVGRMIPDIGMGTLGGGAFNDGVKVSFGSKDYKVNLFATTTGEYYPPQLGVSPNKLNYRYADVLFNLDKDLVMSLAYRQDKDKLLYNAAAFGFEYKGIPDLVLSGEYAENTASLAKSLNGGDDTNAFFLRAKYKGANPMVVGSNGFLLEYKKADPGFDLQPLANPPEWNAPYNYSYRTHGGCANDLQGMEYGFETTIAKRTIFSLTYDDLERVSDGQDQSFLTASVFYLF